MKELKLSPELDQRLVRIEEKELGTSLFGYGHQTAAKELDPLFLQVLNDAGLQRGPYCQGKTFGRELVRLFRTMSGKKLADGLRDALRKWDAYGLRFSLLQEMVLAGLYEYPAGKPPAEPLSRKPKKKRRGTYEQALREGRAELKATNTPAEQATKHRAASEISRLISARVREVLQRHSTPMTEFVRYNAFAYKIGSLARKYGKETLRMTVLDRVDQYEAKGLNRKVLLDLCRETAHVDL